MSKKRQHTSEAFQDSEMNFNMTNKTALVTGGGSGIGRSICQRLAACNATVIVVDLNIESAKQTVDSLKLSASKSVAVSCDISSHRQVREVFSELQKHHKIDMLINNAGIAHVGNLEETSEDDFDRLYQVNVKGVFNAMHATIEHMVANKSGVIVNMASVASSVGIADRFAYSMTKGAVLTMTLSVAKDYVAKGIRCNCVSPGRVHTPFVDNYLEQNYPDKKEEMFDELSKTQPIGRMGSPEEIADLVTYLCSDSATFITGSNFPIDGGFVTLNS